ncbi:MAG: hypothetical protein ACRC2N_01295 [Aeromonas sp.]
MLKTAKLEVPPPEEEEEEDDGGVLRSGRGMASPAKVRKDDEDAVEGFIHTVSPRKQSRKDSPFFTAVLQSARQEYHRVVVFAMEKQSIFNQAEKNGNAVRLRNVKRSISKNCFQRSVSLMPECCAESWARG